MLILAVCTLAVSLQIGCGRTVSHQDPRYFSTVEVGNGNAFVDTLLTTILKKYGPELEPYDLPDLGVRFHKRVFIVNYTGSAELHDGQIWGLPTIHRDGDCTMTNDENGLHAIVQLAMDDLRFEYKGTVTFMGVGPSIDVHGTIDRLSLNLTLVADPGEKAKREQLKVRDIQGIQITFKRLGILEPFVNVISRSISKHLKPLIALIVERKYISMADEILDKFNLRIG